MVLGEAGVVALLADGCGRLLGTVARAGASPCCSSTRAHRPSSWTCRARGSRGRWRCRAPPGSRCSGAGARRSAHRGSRRSRRSARRRSSGAGRASGRSSIGIVCLAAVVAVFVVARRDQPAVRAGLRRAAAGGRRGRPGLLRQGAVPAGWPGWLAATVRRPRRHRALAREHVRTVGTDARRARGADPGDLGDRRVDDPGAELHRGLDRPRWTAPSCRTPLVVETGGDPAVVEIGSRRDRSTTSSTRAGPPTYGWMGPPRPSRWSTLPAMERARGLTAVRGDLGDLGPRRGGRDRDLRVRRRPSGSATGSGWRSTVTASDRASRPWSRTRPTCTPSVLRAGGHGRRSGARDAVPDAGVRGSGGRHRRARRCSRTPTRGC